MSYGYIYKTTNSLNNKIYIGQKKGSFNKNYFGSGLHLIRAIDRYGKDKFKLEIVIYAEDKDKLSELEKQYIKEYREKIGHDNLYNITEGGEGRIAPLSKEQAHKLRQSITGIHLSDEHKAKLRLALLGKKRSDEIKNKISSSKKGKMFSIEHIENLRLSHLGLSSGMKGKHHSEESKNKMRMAKLERV